VGSRDKATLLDNSEATAIFVAALSKHYYSTFVNPMLWFDWTDELPPFHSSVDSVQPDFPYKSFHIYSLEDLLVDLLVSI
jgi:hypothetical protein